MIGGFIIYIYKPFMLLKSLIRSLFPELLQKHLDETNLWYLYLILKLFPVTSNSVMALA